VFIVGGAIAPTLLLMSHMATEVRIDGVYVRFRPFHRNWRRFTFDDMESIEPMRYSPIREYGGWGIRTNFHGGWAYNVSGNLGVQIVMRSGKRVVIGTQRPEEIMAAVNAAQKR
jgi:hypothetical protein